MITEDPHFSLPAIHECWFHLHGRLTASPSLNLDVLQGKGDHTRVLDELFPKQEGSGAIRGDLGSAHPWRRSDMLMGRLAEVPGKEETHAARYP